MGPEKMMVLKIERRRTLSAIMSSQILGKVNTLERQQSQTVN